jgi:hypothetical protein
MSLKPREVLVNLSRLSGTLLVIIVSRLIYPLAHTKNVYTYNNCFHQSVSVHLTRGACLISLYQSRLQFVDLLVRH